MNAEIGKLLEYKFQKSEREKNQMYPLYLLTSYSIELSCQKFSSGEDYHSI